MCSITLLIKVLVYCLVDPISDHSNTGVGRDQNQPRYDIIEKTHRITTDDEGNTTAEETILRQVHVREDTSDINKPVFIPI